MAETISAMAIATRSVKKETRIQPIDITGCVSGLAGWIFTTRRHTGWPACVEAIGKERGDACDDALHSQSVQVQVVDTMNSDVQ